MATRTRTERRARRIATRRHREFQRMIAAADPVLRDELVLFAQRTRSS